jgi:hypothetical protein
MQRGLVASAARGGCGGGGLKARGGIGVDRRMLAREAEELPA